MNATGVRTNTSTVDRELVDMMEAVFAGYRSSHDSGPADARIDYDRALWHRLDELGLVRLTGAEQSGGSGASWRESTELVSAAVRHGVRLPLA